MKSEEPPKPIFSYLEELANASKEICLRCHTSNFLVYLSCGCHDLCPTCAQNKEKCSKEH